MMEQLKLRLHQAKTASEKVAALNALSSATKPRDIDQSLRYALQAEQLAQECSDEKGLADALLNKAIALAPSGQYADVESLLNQAYCLYEKIGDEKGRANALSNFGSLSVTKGNFAEALAVTQQSLSLRQSLGDKLGEAASLNNLGGIHHYLGNFDVALECFIRSLKLKEDIGDTNGKAYTLGNIGSVYRRTGNAQLALDYHRQSLLLWQQLGDKLGEARTRGEIGILLAEKHHYEQAILELDTAKRIFESHHSPHGLANVHRNLADIYRLSHQLEKAFEEIRAGLRYSETIGDKYGEMQACFILGTLYAERQHGD